MFLSNFYRSFCSNNNVIYTTEQLEKLTISQLRELAQEYQINLRQMRTKRALVMLISNFFISKAQAKLEESLIEPTLTSTNLPVLVDSESRIRVDIWFTLLGIRYSRIENSKRFNEMRTALFEVKGIPVNESVVANSEGIFMHRLLALFVASFLNKNLLIDIYDHYLISQESEIAALKMDNERLNNENQLLEFESKLKRTTGGWNTFNNIKHAFYVFSIDDILTIGAVGLPKTENPSENSLDKRLAGHRNTYARLKLISVVIFTTGKVLESFESSIKHILSEFSIANANLSELEQYSCDKEIMLSTISQHIANMKLDTRKLAFLCAEQVIDEYNKKVDEKVGI
jgi:hypothetical protein